MFVSRCCVPEIQRPDDVMLSQLTHLRGGGAAGAAATARNDRSVCCKVYKRFFKSSCLINQNLSSRCPKNERKENKTTTWQELWMYCSTDIVTTRKNGNKKISWRLFNDWSRLPLTERSHWMKGHKLNPLKKHRMLAKPKMKLWIKCCKRPNHMPTWLDKSQFHDILTSQSFVLHNTSCGKQLKREILEKGGCPKAGMILANADPINSMNFSFSARLMNWSRAHMFFCLMTPLLLCMPNKNGSRFNIPRKGLNWENSTLCLCVAKCLTCPHVQSRKLLRQQLNRNLECFELRFQNHTVEIGIPSSLSLPTMSEGWFVKLICARTLLEC